MDNFANFLQPFIDLLKPCVEFIIWLFPLKIYRLHDGQRGVITTFGRVYNWRYAEKGPGTWICFMFEDMVVVQAIGGYIDLVEQAITVTDGAIILINSAIEYDIFSVKKAMLETENIELLISGVAMNIIREYAKTQKNINMITEDETITQALLEKINKDLKKHGVKVKRVMLTDLRPHPIIYICDKIDIIIQKTLANIKNNEVLNGKT